MLLSKDTVLIMIEYLNIHSFINFACLNKECFGDIKIYLKIKKNIFKILNIPRTIDNCFLKITIKMEECIIRVKKKIELNNGQNKNIKIYFWCLSLPGIIGTEKKGYRYVIYPNHCAISEKEINDAVFIPFR